MIPVTFIFPNLVTKVKLILMLDKLKLKRPNGTNLFYFVTSNRFKYFGDPKHILLFNS